MRGLRGLGIQGLANPVFGAGCPGGAFSLPYSVDFTTLPDGALPSVWYPAGWAIASSKAVCTPTRTDLSINGDLSLWTGGTPTGWSKAGTVTQDPVGQARIANGQLYRTVGTGVKLVTVSAECTAFVSGSLVFNLDWGGAQITWTGTGYSARSIIYNLAGNYVFAVAALGDATVDNIRASMLSDHIATVTTTKTDVTVSGLVTTTALTEWVGLVARVDSQSNPQNYIAAMVRNLGGNGCYLYKVVNGIWTSVGSGTGGTGTYELICSGTTITLKRGGLTQVSGTINEATINSNIYHGIIASSISNTVSSVNIYET